MDLQTDGKGVLIQGVLGLPSLAQGASISRLASPTAGDFPGPNGRQTRIRLGSRLKAEMRAMTMARAVRRPKSMLGMKVDTQRIENPIVMVMDV